MDKGVGEALRARRDWILVFLVLAMAIVAIIGILAPRVLDDGGPQGHLATAAGSSASVPGRTGPAPAPTEGEREAAAPAQAAASDDDLPPYGDHSLLHSDTIQGTVTDKEGKPVADAIVVAAYKETQTRPYEIHLASRVRSEQDGYFILGPLERKSYGILAIKEKEGVAYAAGKMPGSWVDLALAPGARLVGTVTTREERKPVAGATVIVRDYVFHQETVTDEEGSYFLAPLPASVNTWSGHEVIVVAEGFQRAERSNLLLKSDKEHRVDFALDAGGSLHGRVVDARTLKPIENAIVAEGWEHYHGTTESGEDGAFVLPNVDIAPNRIFTVRAEGYLSQQRQSDGSGEIEFELDSSLLLGGVIVDQQEKPVPGAKIYLHRIKYAPGFKPARTSKAKTFTDSDENGEFSFVDVLPGQVALVAFHKEHAPGEQGPIEIPVGGPAPDGNKVFLRQGLTVEGEVRDLHDRPIPSVQVSMWRGWGTRLEGYKWLGNYMWSENPIWFSDENGHFTLKGAVPGNHWLSAWDQTFGYTSTQIKGKEGERIDGVILSFAGASITGVLITAEGEPVPGQSVQARGPKNTPQQTWRWTQTDGLGRFKLGGLKEGNYDVFAYTSFGRPDPKKDIPAGTEGVEIKLKANQVLRGSVRSILTGRAVERFKLAIQPQKVAGGSRTSRGGTHWSRELRSPDGTFERPVMPGTYSVTVKAADHAPKVIKEIIVEEHIEPAEIYVTLDGGGGLYGTVNDSAGKPLPHVYVQCSIYRAPGEPRDPMDSSLASGDSTDSKGRYFVQGLMPGTYLLQLNLGRKGAAIAQAVVQGLDMVKQDLVLLPTGTVVLKVVDEEGKPIRGVWFNFRTPEGRYIGWAQQTNAQGTTTSRPMPMGTAMVHAYHGKYTLEPFSITVRSGKTITVDVAMRKKSGGG